MAFKGSGLVCERYMMERDFTIGENTMNMYEGNAKPLSIMIEG